MLNDYNIHDYVKAFVLLKEVSVRYDKNNHPFLSLLLEDRSRIIDGKMWNVTEEQAQQFYQGQVVYVEGELTEFNKRPQLKITKMREATEDEPCDASLYMESAPMTRQAMQEEMQPYIEAMSPVIREIVQTLLSENERAFFNAPAAKTNHHNFSGGLAYHTLSMLRLAKAMSQCYPEINAGLLYAGVVLHDFGKIWEMTGPVSTEYTLAGELIGHIVMIDEAIDHICQMKHIPMTEEVLFLKHMVLSHHGRLEYGSPVAPKLLEAEVLHFIDNMDASMNMMITALNHTEPGSFTERINAMDKKVIYKPKEQ